jgi:antitoxin component YwqK of YwqJK toxin-antitoxin module
MDTCFCNVLDKDTTGLYLLKAKKYTGMCIENYPETAAKYIEKSLLEGQLHGKIKYFDKLGNVLIEEIYESGKKIRSGEVDIIECDCSELDPKLSSTQGVPNRYYLDGIPYTGTCHKSYPDVSQKYMEVSYEQGVHHGRTTYFNKDGSIMYTEKYEKGELISTYH